MFQTVSGVFRGVSEGMIDFQGLSGLSQGHSVAFRSVPVFSRYILEGFSGVLGLL